MIAVLFFFFSQAKIDHSPDFLKIQDYLTTYNALSSIKVDCFTNQIISSKISDENINICFYNCTFASFNPSLENSTILYGSIIRLISSTSKFDLCNFINNSINSTSNCFIFLNSTITFFSKCNFLKNSINITENYNGFIIYSLSCNFTINDCIFRDNYAYSDKIKDQTYIITGNLISIRTSNSSFNNCSFLQNTIYMDYQNGTHYHLRIHGGLIAIYNSLCDFIGCNFANNTFLLNPTCDITVDGGLLYMQSSIGSIKSCIFTENFVITVFRSNHKIWGGLISSRVSNFTFSFCIFMVNTINIEGIYKHDIWGGSIYLYKSYDNFIECSFKNNTIIMNSISNFEGIIFGGSICSEMSIFSMLECNFLENNININSTGDSNIYGGSIFLTSSLITFWFCSFKFNNFSINVHEYDSTIEGGLIYVYQTHFDNFDCLYTNNMFILNIAIAIDINSIAIYFYSSNGTIHECLFTNNIIQSLNRPDIFINGFSLCFSSSNYTIYRTNFINNSALIEAYDNTINYHGEIYFVSSICTFEFCIFNDIFDSLISYNLIQGVYISIYHSKGILDNCIFYNNQINEISIQKTIINGIIYFQYLSNPLSINLLPCFEIRSCLFDINYKSNVNLNSIIYSDEKKNVSSINFFNNNLIRINNPIDTVVFNGDYNSSIRKWNFLDNCLYPYQISYFKKENIDLYDETGVNKVAFNDVFNQRCSVPTFIFTESNVFSNSNSFGQSAQFSNSNSFSQSSQFSNSNSFSQSSQFSNSNIFSFSIQFTDSLQFANSFYFSESLKFSRSDLFSHTNLFTKSNNFSFSKSFSNSNSFSDTKISTQEIPTSTPVQTPKNQKASILSSFTLAYTLIKSVVFSFSYNPLQNTYSYFPYIIYSLSPSFIVTNYVLLINLNKKISPENFIGIVCGSVAVFFSILSIIIFVIKKKNSYRIYLEENDLSSSSSSAITNETNAKTKQFNTDMTIETKFTNLDEFDDWL